MNSVMESVSYNKKDKAAMERTFPKIQLSGKCTVKKSWVVTFDGIIRLQITEILNCLQHVRIYCLSQLGLL